MVTGDSSRTSSLKLLALIFPVNTPGFGALTEISTNPFEDGPICTVRAGSTTHGSNVDVRVYTFVYDAILFKRNGMVKGAPAQTVYAPDEEANTCFPSSMT